MNYPPASLRADMRWNSGSWSHFAIRLKVSRPLFSLDHGFGLRSRSESVPWDLKVERVFQTSFYIFDIVFLVSYFCQTKELSLKQLFEGKILNAIQNNFLVKSPSFTANTSLYIARPILLFSSDKHFMSSSRISKVFTFGGVFFNKWIINEVGYLTLKDLNQNKKKLVKTSISFYHKFLIL